MRTLLLLMVLGAAASAAEQGDKQFDPAAAFGSRPSVSSISLSPDGASIAFIAPSAGRGAVLFTMQLDANQKPRPALTSDGKPVSTTTLRVGLQLAARVHIVLVGKGCMHELAPFTRLIAVDSDGRNVKMLSTQQNNLARGVQLGGGDILDLLPDEDGIVLMARVYIPEHEAGGISISARRSVVSASIESTRVPYRKRPSKPPADGVVSYISDGRGNVRIMGVAEFSQLHPTV